MKWTTLKGEKIEISELEDSHLHNIKKMLERKGFVHSETYWSCLAYSCSTNTPEMAAYAADAELDGMLYSTLTDKIFEEYSSRGIK